MKGGGRVALTVYFLRHGQTAFSRENAFCGSGLDPDLTEDGLKMAEAFAAAYRSTPLMAVYMSSLKRALQTARPLCAALDITPQVREDLREIGYGEWEGLSVDEVDRRYHDDYIRWSSDPAWNSPTGGEPAIMIARRGLRVIEEIKRRYLSGNVLVVSHKATIRIVLCALLGIDVGQFRYRLACPVGSVSIVQFGAQGPLLKALADVSHLGEELRQLPGT
jgi:broad specificity phosphatase PhoE